MAKTKELKLQIDMVPTASWGTSLRNVIPRSKWDKLRKEVHERNGNKCQICGSAERLSCHEHWEFESKTKQQKLVGLGTICGMCHHVTHFGRSMQLERQGYLDLNAVVNHFLRVNSCKRDTFEKHLEQAAAIFNKRSQHAWKVDFGEYKHLVSKSAS